MSFSFERRLCPDLPHCPHEVLSITPLSFARRPCSPFFPPGGRSIRWRDRFSLHALLSKYISTAGQSLFLPKVGPPHRTAQFFFTPPLGFFPFFPSWPVYFYPRRCVPLLSFPPSSFFLMDLFVQLPYVLTCKVDVTSESRDFRDRPSTA